MQEYTNFLAQEKPGPVEGWIIHTRHSVGFVKGCLHPLPLLYYVPRIVHNTKSWDYTSSIYMLERYEPELIHDDHCLGGRHPAINPSSPTVRLQPPYDAYTRVKRTCISSRVCQTALELIEYITSSISDPIYAGFTGGLAYNPENASDIDIVVYGFSNAYRVYKLLRDLRSEGVLKPFIGVGHAWSESDKMLHSMLATRRLLFGLYKEYEYNVKLVSCVKPGKCFHIRKSGKVCVIGRVCRAYPFTIPAVYVLCSSRERVTVLTHRLRFLEIPLNAVVEVCGIVEFWPGRRRIIVPDHGGYIAVVGAVDRDEELKRVESIAD